MNHSSQIWAITSYFNPRRSRRRLENFRKFRRALRSPLLAVELGYGGNFELCNDDADILLQIRGDSVLWQKERLLNVAIGRLPAHVRYVAWIDCDIEFSEMSWTESAMAALQDYCLIQLFENLTDLGPKSTHHREALQYTGKSFAAFNTNGGPETKDFPPGSAISYRPRLPGLAWAGRRSLLETHGFYDAMILGGGDGAYALAAYGRFDEVPHISQFNRVQTNHYLDWARPFFDDVRGNVGFLPGDILHHWHGDLADRRYRERYDGLAQFDFDPSADITIDDQG